MKPHEAYPGSPVIVCNESWQAASVDAPDIVDVWLAAMHSFAEGFGFGNSDPECDC